MTKIVGFSTIAVFLGTIERKKIARSSVSFAVTILLTFFFVHTSIGAVEKKTAIQARPAVVYLGVTVRKFRWRSDLDGWEHSRDLLARVLQKKLKLPPNEIRLLSDPSLSRLDQVFSQELPPLLNANSLLIFYLGTHHLKNARLLLGKKTVCTAENLVRWLQPLPGRKILLADICYAERLEDEATFAPDTMRLYAGNRREKALLLDLGLRSSAARRLFADSWTMAQNEFKLPYDRYSLFGWLLADALSRTKPSEFLDFPALFACLKQRSEKYARIAHRTRTPHPTAYNLQPWPLNVPPPSSSHDSIVVPPRPSPRQAGKERAASLQELLALPDTDIDIGLGNLLIGRMYDPSMKIDPYLQRLDQMAAQLRKRIGTTTAPRKIIRIIGQYLYQEQGFRTIEKPYPEDFLLDRLLDSKVGRCSSLTSLYLALAYRLNLPLTARCVPEHIYVRWKTSRQVINIETTLRGKTLPDSCYDAMNRRVDAEKGKSFYQTDLSPRRIVASFLSPLASVLRDKGRLTEALHACQQALKWNPNDAEAWNNQGMIYRLLGEKEQARQAYNRALSINPGLAEAWNNLGSLETDMGKKIADYRKAVSLKPDLPRAWKNLAYAYSVQEKYPLAWACIRKCAQLGLELPHNYVEAIRNQVENPD